MLAKVSHVRISRSLKRFRHAAKNYAAQQTHPPRTNFSHRRRIPFIYNSTDKTQRVLT